MGHQEGMGTLEEEEDMEEEDTEGVVDAKLSTSKNVTPQTNSNAPLLLINNVQLLMSNSAQLSMNNSAQPPTKRLLNNSAALPMRSNVRPHTAKCAPVEVQEDTEEATEVLVDTEVAMGVVIGMEDIEAKEVQVDMAEVF